MDARESSTMSLGMKRPLKGTLMDESKLYLGIDYGGNTVKLGLIDYYGNLSGKASIPTGDLTSKVACRAFAAEVGEFVHGMGVYTSELGGIGLAVPGIKMKDGFMTPNVKADWPLVLQSLERTFYKVNLTTINDSNAAALGEMWMGAGENAHTELFVTIGTGIGAGLIVQGSVIEGSHGSAGEVGHITVVPGGRECMCGRKGCVERYASARGIVQTFREAGESGKYDTAMFSEHEPQGESDTLAVFEAYREGDPRAIEAIDVMCDKLGFALAHVACVVDPDVIILGGGVASGADCFVDKLRGSFKSYCFPSCSATEFKTASLSNDAGIYGAARYAIISAPRDKAQRDWLDPDFGL